MCHEFKRANGRLEVLEVGCWTSHGGAGGDSDFLLWGMIGG